MPKGTQTRKRMKKGTFIPYMEAAAAPTLPEATTSTVPQTNNSMTNMRRDIPGYDFWTSVSSDELARAQGVQPIRRLGQIRAFSEPDPSEADWLAREVRRWRHETGRTQRRNRH
jgi:hypothetical protein